MFLPKKRDCFVACIFVSLLATCINAKEFTTSIQNESYSLGASTGNYLVNQIYNQQNLGMKTDIELVLEGFKDALKNKQKLKDEEIITHLNNRAEVLNKLQKEKIKKEQKENLEKEKKFLQKSLKDKDTKKTKSGLVYKIIKMGNKKAVREESVVVLNYKATLMDGYVFDDTYKRKAPAHLSMVNIIDGLKEGLLIMKEGGSAKFIIPSKLGYGSVQMRDIPPNSPLIFEVELLKVLEPGALKQKGKSSQKHNKTVH